MAGIVECGYKKLLAAALQDEQRRPNCVVEVCGAPEMEKAEKDIQ